MKISKGSSLEDQEIYSPQQFFTTIHQLNNDVPHDAKKPLRSKRRQALFGFDYLSRQNQEVNIKKDKKTKRFTGLKKIIQEQKIKSLTRNFITKLKRNNINSSPMQFEPFQEQQKSWFENEGLRVPQTISNLMALLGIAQIALLTIFYTLSLVFKTVKESEIIETFQTTSILFYLAELIINFLSIKSVEGRKLTTLKQISQNYLNSAFLLDLLSIIILLIDLTFEAEFTNYLRLLIILKFAGGLERLERLENAFVDNFYKEQYWGLIKVFILNFSFAHFLAIILVAMTGLDSHNNWIVVKGINHAPWYEVYSWAYYWGTTIMLTVGFGDISASNFQEAICLTLIQTFSCITLAYNINYVGNLISNIRSQDIEKNKNNKILNKLSQKNDIPEQLTWRINNYIEESNNIKKKFNFQQENLFISKLPPSLKADFLKQSNKKIFQKIVFFKNLTEKTLLNLAQKIEMRICHPQEVIRRKEGDFNIFILKQGHMGFVCKKSNFDFNDTLIDEVKIKDHESPFLLDLDFISKDRKPLEIKSLQYSILYCLSFAETMKILQSNQLDYQHYCQLRDKSRHIIDQYEVFTCELCSQHHMKFDCPKIHYIPIQQHLILKHIYKINKSKTHRMLYVRRKKDFPTLRCFERYNRDNNQKQIIDLNYYTKNMMSSLDRKKQTIVSLGMARSQMCNSDGHKYFLEGEEEKKFLVQTITQTVADQIGKALSVQKGPEIWIIQCDEARNYKFYFNQSNASHLKTIHQGK